MSRTKSTRIAIILTAIMVLNHMESLVFSGRVYRPAPRSNMNGQGAKRAIQKDNASLYFIASNRKDDL